MKKINLIIGSLIVCVCFIFNLTAYAGDKATPKEVVQKVRTAADFLSKAGKPGLPEFNDPKGRWVWKDTYVWVLDCAK
ncbi:MAG: calcium:proton antiporter, partial [Thermodesulfobacteriota bacterium]|nr:calcium:proton antiporter [Thermodesulfobacteriota bacterium]